MQDPHFPIDILLGPHETYHTYGANARECYLTYMQLHSDDELGTLVLLVPVRWWLENSTGGYYSLEPYEP
jgi:hypothetical protein